MAKSRIFLWVMLAFITGVAVRSFIAVPYVVVWLGGIAAAILFAIGVSRGRRGAWIAGLILSAFFIGVFRYDTVERVRPDLSRLFGKPVAARGIVVRDPAFGENSQRVTVDVAAVDGYAVAPHFFVLATVRKYPAYAIGDALAIEGTLEQPQNFGDFDYVSYLARDNIAGVIPFPKIEKVGEGKGNQLILSLSRLKHAFEEKIDAALPEPHAAFLKGLLLGERASLPKELVEDFKVAGVSHIVALSGYNITIVGRSLTTVLLVLTVPFAVSFWIALAAIILFVLLTGAAASVVRAGIMGILVLFAQKEGRMYRMTNALAVAGAVMIFHNPYILRFDAGFQLSFLATMGLVYLSPEVEQWLVRVAPPQSTSSFVLKLRQIFVETMSAQLMVLPLLIYLFGRVSLISPVTNILVLLAVPHAMTIGFFTGVLGFISASLSAALGWATWILLEYQLRIIAFFAHIPLASITVGAWVLAPFSVVYVGLLWRIWRRSHDTQK